MAMTLLVMQGRQPAAARTAVSLRTAALVGMTMAKSMIRILNRVILTIARPMQVKP